MRGSSIIVSDNPRGRTEGIVVSGTPKPGTHMEIVPSTATVGGRFTMRAATRGDGAKGPLCILLEDDLQGSDATKAYVSGAHGKVYWPIAGEEFNLLLRYQPGTGTALDENIGDLLEVDGATGMLQGIGTTGPSTNHVSAPYQLLEHLGVALSANTLVWVKCLGGNA